MPRAAICKLYSLVLIGTALGGCSVALNPLGEAEMQQIAGERLQSIATNQEPLTRPVDLYEAMARALKYNLDRRLEAAQGSLRLAELDLAHFSLLPNAVAGSGYARRDSFNASSSFNLITNTPNFGASTSQDKDIRTADLAFSWHILDFGLSWVRARQAGDKALIAEELQRRVTHRLLEDVRTAYWRALSYERLVGRLRQLELRAHGAMVNARTLSGGRDVSPITALTYERELIEVRRAIKELQRDLVVARSQLAALINVSPGTRFSLAGTNARTVSGLGMPLQDMIAIAVRDRPELREVTYQQRINRHEAHAAMLEMLPGIQLYAGPNYDSNSFLLDNNWVSWGAKASWNLLKVFQYPARRAVVEEQQEVLKMRAQALTMAVMTQVSVSRQRYMHFADELRIAREFLDVQRRLVEQIRSEARANRVSEHTLIREEMNTLVAEAKHDITHASLQTAYANVFASIGADPYGAVRADRPVSEIANGLRRHWQGLARPVRVAEVGR